MATEVAAVLPSASYRVPTTDQFEVPTPDRELRC
jgi:hypothetical protein